jgi:TolA-binding protein
MQTQWIGIAVSVLVMLGGTAVNLFIIGRFVGQWSEAMRNIAATLQRVEERVEEVGERGDENHNAVAMMQPRIDSLEATADKFYEMRDAFIRMTTTIEFEGKQTREQLQSLARGQSVIERQLGNLVSSKAGFTTINNEDTNR